MLKRIECFSAACYQAYWAYTGAGDKIWTEAPHWIHSAIRHSVQFWEALDVVNHDFNKMVQASHLAWVSRLTREGWKYGPSVRDDLKTHPNLVPFTCLSHSAQQRESVLLRTYLVMREILGDPPVYSDSLESPVPALAP